MYIPVVMRLHSLVMLLPKLLLLVPTSYKRDMWQVTTGPDRPLIKIKNRLKNNDLLFFLPHIRVN